MEQRIFIFILYLILFFRGVLTPLLIVILFPFNKKLRKRIKFEQINLTSRHSRSFMRDGLQAHVAFEVSSEGEFEQIKPILNLYLEKAKRVELIYSSTSLEKKLQLLVSQNDNLRLLRLPVVSFGLFNNTLMQTQNVNDWLTAPVFILCRYDFFPELLLYGANKSHRFCLVSATLKNKSSNSWYLKNVYKLFDYILSATPIDDEKLTQMGIASQKHSCFEFRILQIADRLKNTEKTLAPYQKITDWLKEVPREKRIIFGSAWSIEMGVFSDTRFTKKIENGEYRVLILPHQFTEDLDSKISTPIIKGIEELEAYGELPAIINLHIKGILCELYGLCGHAFVGGGHGRSVHSLLEPFLAGCHVYCGPKVHRSTEYDFVHGTSPQDITLVSELPQFYTHLMEVPSKDLVAARDELSYSFVNDFNNKVELLLGGQSFD